MSEIKSAIVTGSSRGIGRAIALSLAGCGYCVTINYNSRADAAAEVVREIEDAGGSAIAVGGSVADADARQQLIEKTVAATGRLDVLVNNAGITSQGRKDLLEATEESWDAVFDTNLKGAFFLSQLAARKMIELNAAGTGNNVPHGGAPQSIVNVSSISAYAASTHRADYCMAKAGMEMMTWLLADRLAEENIMVYEVAPGVIASDMTAPVQEKYNKLIEEGMTPIRRWGKPSDVATAVSSLVTGALPFCTGQRVNIDGGFHIRRL